MGTFYYTRKNVMNVYTYDSFIPIFQSARSIRRQILYLNVLLQPHLKIYIKYIFICFQLFIHLISFTFFCFFWPYHTTCGILVPQVGIEPRPPAVEDWSPHHRTTLQDVQMPFLKLDMPPVDDFTLPLSGGQRRLAGCRPRGHRVRRD